MRTHIREIGSSDYIFTGNASAVHCRDGLILWVQVQSGILVVTVSEKVEIERGMFDTEAIWLEAR